MQPNISGIKCNKRSHGDAYCPICNKYQDLFTPNPSNLVKPPSRLLILNKIRFYHFRTIRFLRTMCIPKSTSPTSCVRIANECRSSTSGPLPDPLANQTRRTVQRRRFVFVCRPRRRAVWRNSCTKDCLERWRATEDSSIIVFTVRIPWSK